MRCGIISVNLTISPYEVKIPVSNRGCFERPSYPTLYEGYNCLIWLPCFDVITTSRTGSLKDWTVTTVTWLNGNWHSFLVRSRSWHEKCCVSYKPNQRLQTIKEVKMLLSKWCYSCLLPQCCPVTAFSDVICLYHFPSFFLFPHFFTKNIWEKLSSLVRK